MKKLDLLNDDVKKIYIKYLIPSVLSSVAVSLYVLVDTMFIGLGVGSKGLAALNINIPIFAVISALSLAVGIGGATTLSVAVGEGKDNEKNKIFTMSLGLSIILGVIISILGNIFAEKICIFLGATPDILGLVKEYFVILISFTWAFLISGVLGNFIRNDKNPKLVMRATIIANITNIILDYIFIFPMDMGIKGAILATVISPVISIILLLTHFIRGNSTLKLEVIKIDFKLTKRIFKNGFGIFVQEISRSLIIFIFNNILIKLGGEQYIAAYGVIINVAYVGTSVFGGIAQSIQPIVSMNFGAKKIKRIYLSLRYALVTSIVLALIFYGVILAFPQFIVRLFTKGDVELINIASQGMKIYFSGFMFVAGNVVTLYFLQSIEKARHSIIISLSSGMLFVIAGLIVFTPTLNVTGVWLSVPVAEIITFLISVYFLIRAKKRLLCETG